MGGHSTRDLFRYLVADEADHYIAIMTCFDDLLLADLSAAEIVAREPTIDAETAETRCRQLVRWGNLALSERAGSSGTVSEYMRARSRYRVTVAGARVHRESVTALAARDGVREVARESLARIAGELADIDVLLGATGAVADPDALAGHVTGVFAHHRLFTDSVTDFYNHLAEVLNRLTPSREGQAESKLLLLDYVDVITSDVGRYAPLVATRLAHLMPRLDHLLAALPGTGFPDALRSPGRTRAEWQSLAEWFAPDAAPRRLRDAAATALNTLLLHTRRLTTTSPGFSHRADLLRLAGWFSESSDEQAHRLFTAAFGAYPGRHVLLGPDEPDPRVGPGTSWWHVDPVVVPVSLRERGDRSSRGRTARLPDPIPDRARAEALAESEALRREEAVTELCEAGALHGARISPEARDILLDALGMLLARNQHFDDAVQFGDDRLGLVLTAEPGPDTVVDCPDGQLTVHALSLRVSPVARVGHPVGAR